MSETTMVTPEKLRNYLEELKTLAEQIKLDEWREVFEQHRRVLGILVHKSISRGVIEIHSSYINPIVVKLILPRARELVLVQGEKVELTIDNIISKMKENLEEIMNIMLDDLRDFITEIKDKIEHIDRLTIEVEDALERYDP